MKFESSVEVHPQLPIALLRRHGVFQNPGTESSFGSRQGDFQIRYEDGFVPHVVITWEEDHQPQSQKIPVAMVRRRFGSELCFVCTRTNSAVTRLHFVDGSWKSRKALRGTLAASPCREQRQLEWIADARDRLAGENGFRKARGKLRLKILERLDSLPFSELRFRELSGEGWLVEKLRQRARSVRQRARRQILTTALALGRGRRLKEAEATSLLGRFAGVPSAVSRLSPDSELLIAEDTPSLDLRTLSREPGFGVGIWGHSLVWRRGSQSLEALLVADFRGSSPHLVILPRDGGQSITPHRIDLVAGKHRRRSYLVCPVTGQRKDLLYLRSGRFADFRAQRLVHRSQRKVR